MKHVTIAEKSLLIGDAAADMLVRYAALLAKTRSGDTIAIRAYGIDGEQVEATFLLNSGTTLLSESSRSELPEPDNAQQVEYMRERLEAFESTGADLATASGHPED